MTNSKLPIFYAAGRIEKSRHRFGLVDCVLDERELQHPSTAPIRRDSVDGVAFGYSGPYTLGCDHGCSHAPTQLWTKQGADTDFRGTGTHGSAMSVCISKGPEVTANSVHARALDGIHKADFVFAWIEDMECFGTLYEIG